MKAMAKARTKATEKVMVIADGLALPSRSRPPPEAATLVAWAAQAGLSKVRPA